MRIFNTVSNRLMQFVLILMLTEITVPAVELSPREITDAGMMDRPSALWESPHQMLLWDKVFGGKVEIVDTYTHKRTRLPIGPITQFTYLKDVQIVRGTVYWVNCQLGGEPQTFSTMNLQTRKVSSYKMPPYSCNCLHVQDSSPSPTLWFYGDSVGCPILCKTKILNNGTTKNAWEPVVWPALVPAPTKSKAPVDSKLRVGYLVPCGRTVANRFTCLLVENRSAEWRICQFADQQDHQTAAITGSVVLPAGRRLEESTVIGNRIILLTRTFEESRPRTEDRSRQAMQWEIWSSDLASGRTRIMYKFPLIFDQVKYQPENEPSCLQTCFDNHSVSYIWKGKIWQLQVDAP